MKKKTLRGIILFVIVAMILYLNSCTVAFCLIGNTEDRTTPEIADTIPGWEAREVKSGAQIIVNLKDGSMVSGKYLGIESIPNEKYAEKYAELQKQMPEGSFLPSIGDTITVSSKVVTQSNLKFYGFDNEHIILSLIESNNPEKVKLESLESIEDKHGNLIEGETIRKLMYKNEIPPLFLSRIAVEEHTAEEDEWGENKVVNRFIDVNNIDQIQIKSVKRGAKTGILTGCIVDGVIAGTFYGLLLYGLCHLP